MNKLMVVLFFWGMAVAAPHALAAVYDGSQSNNVMEASVAGARRAAVSFRVQSPVNENPM